MSLKICCLASGSKGNCCYVSDGTDNILVDLGISALRAEKCLEVLGVDPDSVAVAVTHSHTDHVGGIKSFVKRHPSVNVYCQKECEGLIARAAGVTPVVMPREFCVGKMTVTAIAASHDVPCFGYVITDGVKRVSVMTDVGTVNRAQLDAFCACDIVMIECNHDREMLAANPNYTPVLKARIASCRGHLSNTDCAGACAFLASSGVKNFILAHLSEENNTDEKALAAVRSAVISAGVLDARIIAAKQNEMTGLYEVC